KAILSKEKVGANNIIIMPAKEEANVLLRDVSELFQKYQSVKLIDLSLRIPTLDDVFLELTGSKLRD
ncbi:MAG: hypothetical protein ACFFDS_07870, partial [Candidatus Thorarchaeota archaeon]